MSSYLRIVGGKVYDPLHQVDGQVKTILIANGRVVDQLPDGAAARTIDAAGLIVMPGGIDMHCHIASPGINTARMMLGEEHAGHTCGCKTMASGAHLRSGSGLRTPSTFLTGYRYAALGYTTAIDAAVAPSGARATHLQLDDTPNLDAGFLLLLANHQHLIQLLDKNQRDDAIAFAASLLYRTGAFGIKAVNPGGVATWRRHPDQAIIEHIDQPIPGLSTSRVTPRLLITTLADAAESLGLPHPVHIHCNRLGLPGNVQTTLDTMAALEGRRAHLAHLQFHAYGQTGKGQFTSAAAVLCDALSRHRHITADIGQVMFGPALTITGDTPLEHTLWQLTGQRYVSIESELEAGCGIMPIEYRNKQYLSSLQWAIGLELVLGCDNLWQLALSTDHPNGAAFLAYPAIIAALMSQAVRQEQMRKAHPRALKTTQLPDMTRELSLGDIAILTRAAPARMLGLTGKGHLGQGADGDVTLYHDLISDPQKMFASPRYVIARGQVIVEDGELRAPQPPSTSPAPSLLTRRLRAALAPDPRGDHQLNQWSQGHGSYDITQFGMHPHELSAMTAT